MTVCRRSPRQARPHLHKSLDARHVEHGHEPFVLRSKRPNFLPQHWGTENLECEPTRWLASPAWSRPDSDGGLLQKHHARLGPRTPHPLKTEIPARRCYFAIGSSVSPTDASANACHWRTGPLLRQRPRMRTISQRVSSATY